MGGRGGEGEDEGGVWGGGGGGEEVKGGEEGEGPFLQREGGVSGLFVLGEGCVRGSGALFVWRRRGKRKCGEAAGALRRRH